MSAQRNDSNAQAAGAEPQPTETTELQPIGANELRLLTIPRRMFGYDQENVDEALDRAAHTIEELVRRAKQHEGMLDDLTGQIATLQGALEQARQEQPQPARADAHEVPLETALAEGRGEAGVGEVLARAHSLAEKHIRKAREEASAILTEARARADAIFSETSGERDRLERLLHDAETEVEQARFHAKTMLESARSERDELIDGALAVAERRLADLRGESALLVANVDDIRPEDPASPPAPHAESRHADPDEEQHDSAQDVVSDLQARLVDGPAS